LVDGSQRTPQRDVSFARSRDLGAAYTWYDNEFGFANTLLAHVVELSAPQPIEEFIRR